ncbi:MAG: major capsid protein [Microviridae sp.]|nr:MAG: major capsid protein [Microviridae sp.]
MSAYKGFNKVKLTKPQRSTFDLTHDKRISMQPGKLIPGLVMEAIPSDQFNGSSEMLLRLLPLLAPIYDQLIVYVHFFFVPNRLLWADWETFITGGRLGVGVDPVDAPIPPYHSAEDFFTYIPTQESSLMDYLGIPILSDIDNTPANWTDVYIDAMPVLAYNLIYQNYYRDRNFVSDTQQDVYPYSSGLIGDFLELYTLKSRNYMHDYFTSALPFTQRGEEVLIPIDGAVTYLESSRIMDATDNPVNSAQYLGTDDSGGLGRLNIGGGVPNNPFSGSQFVRVENIDEVTNISSTINDFRSAYALQVWLERNAVGGSRYTESTQAHFGVRPQDSRLQRPEYIGGGRINIKISEVVATANSLDADDNVVPQANMAGHGVSYGTTNSFNYFCTEHGFIMGIISIMNPPSYHQGLPRMFRRRSFLDYPWPTFAKLGEQQVDAAELYASPTNLTADDDGILPLFGYQSRYADWKYVPNTVHGAFHSSLLFWTGVRDFSASPELGAEFLAFDPTTIERMFAVNDGSDQFIAYVHNRVMVKRPLPYFGTPNTLGFV